jgi:hypothetical protein
MSAANGITWGAPISFGGGANLGITSSVLDATTDKAEFIFRAPEAITITRLGIRATSVTGTPGNYKISLQGVTAATGFPDGTILGGGSPASDVFTPAGWSSGSFHWQTLDNSYVCTRGERMAVVVEYDSGTVDGSNFLSASLTVSTGAGVGFPVAIDNQAGSRTKQANVPIFGYGSATTAYGNPYKTGATQTFNSGSTPDEYALRFLIPAGHGDTFKLRGVEVLSSYATGQTTKVVLYDGTTVLQDVTYDNDEVNVSTTERFITYLFDEVTLSTLTYGSAYRVGVVPMTATNVAVDIVEAESNDDTDAWQGGKEWYLSTRSDAGAWTDVTTRRPVMRLIFDDIAEPTGSGAGPLVGPGRLVRAG